MCAKLQSTFTTNFVAAYVRFKRATDGFCIKSCVWLAPFDMPILMAIFATLEALQ